MGSQNIPNKDFDITELIIELRDFFDTNNYALERRDGPSGSIIFDATSKSSKLEDWLGLSRALTVRLIPGSEVTRVRIGNQKWVDKIVVGFIGLSFSFLLGDVRVYEAFSVFLLLRILAFLLIILPALGAYWQYKFTQDTWNVIKDHLAVRPRTSS